MSGPTVSTSHDGTASSPADADLTRRALGVNAPSRRFLLYSHDGLGLGHFRRNLLLAEAVMQATPEAVVLLACSAEALDTFPLPAGVDVLRLPGLRKVDNGHYVGRRLHLARPELHELRASLLASAVRHLRPHVLLADKHPLGVEGELTEALHRHRDGGGRAVLGLRDVLDDPVETAREWDAAGLRAEVDRLYDLVLIYGSEPLLSPLTAGLMNASTQDRVRYCGYVARPPQRGGAATGPTDGAGRDDLPRSPSRPLVLATVGGGEDGLAVLLRFIEASLEAPWRGVVVAGPQMPREDWARIVADAARSGVVALRSVSEVQRWYPHVDALVCMGGYNSLVEAVASGTPTVCVPRVRPRTEQLIRARAFAARGLLELVDPDVAGAGTLRDAIVRALDHGTRRERGAGAEPLDLGGASRAAGYLVALAEAAAAAPVAARTPARPAPAAPARVPGSARVPPRRGR